MTTESGRQRHFWFSFGVERLGLLPTNAPKTTAIVILIVSALAVFGVLRLSVDDSLSELFRTDTEEFKRYEQVSERFPSSEFDVLVVVEGRKLLTPEPLEALRRSIMELGLTDPVRGVVSLFSTRQPPDADGYPPPLFPADMPTGRAFDDIIENLRGNKVVKGKLLSDDGELALVVVALDKTIVADAGLETSVAEIKTIFDEGLSGTGLSFRLTGAPVMQLEIRNAVKRDRIIYNGLGFLLGALIALIFFRRISLTIIAVAGPAAAVLWSLGAVGYLDFRLNLFVNVITPLIMVNGFSDSMHLVFNIRRDVMMGIDKQTAVRNAVLNVAPACFLTALTAAIAVASFIFAKSALIKTFGAASTLAVIIAYIAVVIVVPALGMLLVHPEKIGGEAKPSKKRDLGMDMLNRASVGLFHHVGRYAVAYVLAGIIAVILSGFAYMNLKPHYRLADQVPDSEQALAATGRLDKKLTGANPVHVMIEWKTGAPLFTEATMDIIGMAHDIVEKQAGVGNVWSVHSLRRWVAEAGDTRLETVENYVNVLPVHLTQRFVATERDAVLITGRLPDIDAGEILPVVSQLDEALEAVRKAHPEFTVSVTGLPAIAARNSAQMIWELNVGLVSDIAVVIILLGIAFRSVYMSLVSILPSLFPIFATGAFLYVLGDGLHFASMIALTVAFGLALDSTIHFLNRLDIEMRDDSGTRRDVDDVLARTARMIGPVIILTTIVLALGLGVTVLSDLPSLRIFGQLSGVTLFAALIAQLIILPATIALVLRMRAKNA